jgi:hypothetical protein
VVITEKKISVLNPEFEEHKKRIEELKKAPKSEANDKLIGEMIASMPVEKMSNVSIFDGTF